MPRRGTGPAYRASEDEKTAMRAYAAATIRASLKMNSSRLIIAKTKERHNGTFLVLATLKQHKKAFTEETGISFYDEKYPFFLQETLRDMEFITQHVSNAGHLPKTAQVWVKKNDSDYGIYITPQASALLTSPLFVGYS